MSFIPVQAFDANFLIKRCLATVEKLPAWPHTYYRECLELAAEHLEFGNIAAATHALGKGCDSITSFSEAGIEAIACKEAFDSLTENMGRYGELASDEDEEGGAA